MDAETREYLDAMRRELAGRFDAIDQRFEAVDQRFETVDRRFDTVDQRFEGVDQRFEGIARTITAEAEETRRHFGVIAEALRSDIKLLVDGLEINRREMGAFRDEMHGEFAARDAVLQAGFSQLRRDVEDVRRRL